MKDIVKKSDTELEALVAEKRLEVQQIRFGTGSRNVKAIKTAKKDIARALFELGKRASTNKETQN